MLICRACGFVCFLYLGYLELTKYNLPMQIYFVRHGEGHHNANNLYSLPEFELTEKGKEQARGVAGRLKHLPIEILIVSPYKRTVQTAEIINQVLNKPVVYSELAVEIKRPSEIAGKPIDHPESQKIRNILDSNSHLPDFHFSDEENFFDLKTRAQKFLKFLETFEEKNRHLAVVTHAVFIKMLALNIILQDALTPQGFLNAYHPLSLATSGLTVCEKNEKGWKLITWNDQSHLGE